MTNKLRFLQNLLALSAATLIITIWSTVSYLAYQNKLLKSYTKTNSSTVSTTESDVNQEDITNWKTYKNEKYGFKFKYPQDWKILSTDYGADIVDAENQHLITLNAINNITDLDKFFNNQKNDPGFKTVTLYPIRHQGFTSLHQTLINEYSTDIQHHVWIKYDSTLYEFTFLADNPKDIEYATQIISSFSFFDIFRNNLFNTNVLAQIPELTLPNGLEFVQLAYPQELNGVYYVFFRKHNMNNPINSAVSRSGVLYAGKNDTSWKIFFEIKELNDERNNPYFFWKENDYFYVVLIDANGGGSGEGLGKLIKIKSTDNNWQVMDCFYFVPESFNQFINSASTGTLLSKRVEDYNEPSDKFTKNNGIYTFDDTKNMFVIGGAPKESCTSFKLEF